MHHHHQQHGKPPKPNKISARSVNTVNLGLQYSVLSERENLQSAGGKNDSYTYPTTYSLASVFGGGSNSLSKLGNQQKRKDNSTSYGRSFLSQQGSALPVTSRHKNNAAVNTIYTSHSKSIIPLDSIASDTDKRVHHRHQEMTSKHQKSQVSLPGDRVIFAESPSAPGVPIIYRLDEERFSNPDKLNLDRRKLHVCPLLEGEENLRLLNFQHNMIRKIQHLSMLKKLIFLDLYDNQLEEISGLGALKTLRVLMLGKNRIERIENLQELTMLDVLDLHGNKISTIENLSHLHQLRVLNLAGNDITIVKNITGLGSVTELNLRRNYIHTVYELEELPYLQRLFLSFNAIKKFDDTKCLSKCNSLVELAMDGNPFATSDNYKQLILQNMISLRQLDMKRISEEEKRIAIVMARKEEERRREHERQTSIREKRRLAINNAQKQWKKQLHGRLSPTTRNDSSRSHDEGKKTSRSSSRNSNILCEKSSAKLNESIKDFSSCHLAELDNEALHLYGSGSLNAIDKSWGDKTTQVVTTLVFKYITFNNIVPHLARLNTRFPSLTTLTLDTTNISSLNDINALAYLQHLDHLYLTEDGNPITKLSLWKSYVIYRLTELKLKTLNGEEITDEDVFQAEKLFGSLSHITISKLTQTSLLLLLSNSLRHEDLSENKGKKQDNKVRSDGLSKAGLFYRQSFHEHKEDIVDRQKFSSNYIREMLHTSIMADRKRKALDAALPTIFSDLIGKYVKEITDVDKYCENALEKIKKSVNCTAK